MCLEGEVAIVTGAGSGFGVGVALRANGIVPVPGQTASAADFIGGPAKPGRLKVFVATIPLGCMSGATDLAAAAVLLASDEAEFFAGAVPPADGGRTI